MDSLDLLMPNTINWHAEEFPSDLQEVEPLLSDTAMNIDQMNGILGISDFSLDDLGFNNNFSDFNSVCNFNDNKSLDTADNMAKSASISSDASTTESYVHMEHNYAAIRPSIDSYNRQNIVTDESCCVGVDETFAYQINETSDVTNDLMCNSDVMWCTSKENIPSSSSSSSPSSGHLKFHENSISELARKQVIAELPNFKPTVLTEEEKLLLVEEGVVIPSDLPLTKSEEKALKKVRRKIRNKKSAKVSRQKKKNYIEGLEARINETSGRNLSLNRRVDELQKENASLKDKLRRLMSQVSRQAINCKESRYTQASSCLFVVAFAICFLTPWPVVQDKMEIGQVDNHLTRRVLSTTAEDGWMWWLQRGVIADQFQKLLYGDAREFVKRELPSFENKSVKIEPQNEIVISISPKSLVRDPDCNTTTTDPIMTSAPDDDVTENKTTEAVEEKSKVKVVTL